MFSKNIIFVSFSFLIIVFLFCRFVFSAQLSAENLDKKKVIQYIKQVEYIFQKGNGTQDYSGKLNKEIINSRIKIVYDAINNIEKLDFSNRCKKYQKLTLELLFLILEKHKKLDVFGDVYFNSEDFTKDNLNIIKLEVEQNKEKILLLTESDYR